MHSLWWSHLFTWQRLISDTAGPSRLVYIMAGWTVISANWASLVNWASSTCVMGPLELETLITLIINDLQNMFQTKALWSFLFLQANWKEIDTPSVSPVSKTYPVSNENGQNLYPIWDLFGNWNAFINQPSPYGDCQFIKIMDTVFFWVSWLNIQTKCSKVCGTGTQDRYCLI